MNKVIYIIGAGQLGSRHLQALKAISTKLEIHVFDPSSDSLAIAKDRYESINNSNCVHSVEYHSTLEFSDQIDIAIIATNSNVRKDVVLKLLNKTKISFLILEKLLFQKKEDYFEIEKAILINECMAWVNCSMRSMPFYYNLKNEITSKKVIYSVTGSNFGLVTNLIHYIDHIVFLTGCSNFSVQTDFLEKTIISSKRKGFLELNGVAIVNFENASLGIFSSYNSGTSPAVVQIETVDFRCISKETLGKVWLSKAANHWQWEEVNFPIPFQSQMTTTIVEELLTIGTCKLVSYSESMHSHLQLLEPLLKFVNENIDDKIDYYPFT